MEKNEMKLLWANLTFFGAVIAIDRRVDQSQIKLISGGVEISVSVSLNNEENNFYLYELAFSQIGLAATWESYAGEVVSVVTPAGPYDIYVPPDGVILHLENVSDFAVSGWAAMIFGAPTQLENLSIYTGSSKLPIERTVRADLLDLYPADQCFGFRAQLPAWCFDGLEHEIIGNFGSRMISKLPFRSDVSFNVEPTNGDRVQLWFTDFGQSDQPFTVIVTQDGVVAKRLCSTDRRDVFDAIGRLWVGIDTDLPRSGKIEISLGSNRQLLIASVDAENFVEVSRQASRLLLESRHLPVDSLAIRNEIGSRARAHQLENTPVLNIDINNLRKQVCIIIPVYLGLLETQQCFAALEEYYVRSKMIKKIIVIDDCSPSPEISELCKKFKENNREVVELIINAENRGFVKSVNSGFASCDRDCDVLLLNADAVVSSRTLAKLKYIAYSDRSIATVTPLTNNGTIFSYPEVNAANGMSIEESIVLDRQCEALRRGEYAVVPVGVGYCMYIKEHALKDVGLLGEEWGRGYCEEVDWCLRARDLGYVHVAALDTFVWHEGSVSFGAAEREEILQKNHKLLEGKYPEYIPDIMNYMRNDPLESIRIDLFCLKFSDSNRLTVHLCHDLGGGTKKYLKDVSDLLRMAGSASISLHRETNTWLGVEVNVAVDRTSGRTLRMSDASLDRFLGQVGQASSKLQVVVHSLIQTKREWIYALKGYGAKIAVMCHDFQWYCPRVVLLDHRKRYCGEPDVRFCTSCVMLNGSYEFGNEIDAGADGVAVWKQKNYDLLRIADNIVAPSADTAQRFGKAFPSLKVSVLPHPGSGKKTTIRKKEVSLSSKVRIAIVGALNTAKGADFLREICFESQRQMKGVIFRLFGAVSNQADFANLANFQNHGRYEPDQLSSLLCDFKPDFVLLPGVWPETYSYVLSEVWIAGYPVVALDLGAVAERIKETGGGIVVRPDVTAVEFIDMIPGLINEVGKLAGTELIPDENYSALQYERRLFST